MGRGSGGGGRGGGKAGGGGAGASAPAKPSGPPTAADVARAFAASPGARDDFVALADIRAKIGGTRAEQDAAINAARRSGRFAGESYSEGHGVHATPRGAAIRAAAIVDRTGKITHLSRR